MPEIKIIATNDHHDSLLMPAFVKIEDYDNDKKANADNLEKINDIIENIYATNLALLDDIKRRNFSNMMVQQHQQLEILMGIRDDEINIRWTKRMLEFSWFTKIFRKKYMQSEFVRIKNEVYEKMEPMFKEINKSIKDMKDKWNNLSQEE